MEGSSGSGVWKYFKKKDKDNAQCSRCPKILSCKGSSTSGLARHLEKVHNIVIKPDSTSATSSASTIPLPPNEPSTSSAPLTEAVCSPIPTKKIKSEQSSLERYFQKPPKLSEIVAELAAKDGLTIRQITCSQYIRKSLLKDNLILPKNESHVMNLILSFFEEQKLSVISTLNKLIKEGSRFSITLDEWTSIRNRRYFNVILHGDDGKLYNLGLTFIPGRCGAKETRQIVESLLTEYNISFEQHIVAATTDGANVMKKFGHESPATMMLCINHAIHLAVTDVLYKRNQTHQDEVPITQEDVEISGSDGDDFSFSNEEEDSMTCSEIQRPDLKKVLDETRRIVKLFRKSPLMNGILQNHVKTEFHCELSLYLDIKTRWNSIETMIERFLKLKNCIKKALIDLEKTDYWQEENVLQLENLLAILNPIKLAVEALSSRDCTILKCEAIITILLKKIKEIQTPLAEEFFQVLQERIADRRNATLFALVKYLHIPVIQRNDMFPDSAVSKTVLIK